MDRRMRSRAIIARLGTADWRRTGLCHRNPKSKLLLTSRFVFARADIHGKDLAATFFEVSLPSMSDRERDKQLQAAVRVANFDESAGDDPEQQTYRASTLNRVFSQRGRPRRLVQVQ